MNEALFVEDVGDTPSLRTHRVRDGENLSSIAFAYYGDGDAWVVIYRHNRDAIQNPDRIYPGQQLIIPFL